MINASGNIFAHLPDSLPEELFQELLRGEGFKLERIVSGGHATPVGQWYDQEQYEWVVLLSGSAGLRFEDQENVHEMRPGDFVNISAHRRHRVEWTNPKEKTVWLALHYSTSDGGV
jgi:cupin 2 domain-containing protein